MKKALLISAVCAAMVGCSGGSSSGFTLTDKVEYHLDPNTGASCKSPDRASDFQMGDYVAKTCTWHCARYDGRGVVYTSLTFEKSNSTGGKWVLGNEFVSGKIC